MSKYKQIFRALKLNITTKAVKLKSTDQFDSRRGQNFKMQFRGAFFFVHYISLCVLFAFMKSFLVRRNMIKMCQSLFTLCFSFSCQSHLSH